MLNMIVPMMLMVKTSNESVVIFQLVRGTGPEGRVTAKDVETFVPSAAVPAVPPSAIPPPPRAAAAPAVAPTPGAAYTDIPLSNIRQVSRSLDIIARASMFSIIIISFL